MIFLRILALIAAAASLAASSPVFSSQTASPSKVTLCTGKAPCLAVCPPLPSAAPHVAAAEPHVALSAPVLRALGAPSPPPTVPLPLHPSRAFAHDRRSSGASPPPVTQPT